MHITVTFTKVVLFAIFMLVVATKVTSVTDNMFSSYGDNTRLAQVASENNSLKGGV
jgi:hypothetical protein